MSFIQRNIFTRECGEVGRFFLLPPLSGFAQGGLPNPPPAPIRARVGNGCTVLSRGADILWAAFLPLAAVRDASSHNRSDSRSNL